MRLVLLLLLVLTTTVVLLVLFVETVVHLPSESTFVATETSFALLAVATASAGAFLSFLKPALSFSLQSFAERTTSAITYWG